jgi:uncharacterized glyoxalase superfamily metalloenzyme YdcJ
MAARHIHSNDIRTMFSRAMSEMYRAEVPQYGTLLDLVGNVNAETLRADPRLKASFEQSGEAERLGIERHGAIRLGTAQELFDIRRVFAVMGMHPVGYYDLSVAGVPVHSTAFRPIDDEALRCNPFRVFASLLRLDLIDDPELRDEAEAILSARRIFKPRALELVAMWRSQRRSDTRGGGGVRSRGAGDLPLAQRRNGQPCDLPEAARRSPPGRRRRQLQGPHINHLTPRTLDIDALQAGMPNHGIAPKAVIEGPPRRNCPILLRQTSFKALEEPIVFKENAGEGAAGTHTARFGEIEQRGVALTARGRKLYDDLLASVRREVQVGVSGANAVDYDTALSVRFESFPDSWAELRAEGLAFFRYSATQAGVTSGGNLRTMSVEQLIERGFLRVDPIIYEDFLPVSAAGIFQSNLGTDAQKNYAERSNRAAFEVALGAVVRDELELYAETEKASLDQALKQLGSSIRLRASA